MGISGAAGKECFLCDLLVWDWERSFPTLGTWALTALQGLPSHCHHNGGCELEAQSSRGLRVIVQGVVDLPSQEGSVRQS